MAKTRSQEDESEPQWFSRFWEANDQRISRLEAMVADLLCRSRKGKKENPEDQICNDEELIETEHGTVKCEANANMILANLEEESMPQFQVPVSDLEHGLRIHNASSIVCEDSQYVVGCDELCDHQKSILQVSYVKEVEELPQKSTSGNGEHVAHQLFDQMPSKEKHMKHLKAWKFKFKPTSKRSKLMDDMFSFVEETALLKKDPKETIWDCARKGFKETMAACGKKRVDRFKLLDETSKPAVYDRPFQIRVWDSGGSPLERVDDEFSGDDKSSEVIDAETVVKLMHKPLMDNKYSSVDESSGKDVKVLEEQQGFKAQVCSGFDVKALIWLETYGWEYKKQMLILTRSYVLDVLSLDDGVFITAKRLLENRDEMDRDVTLRSLLGLTFGRRESNARQEHQAVCEQIIMVNVWLYQISLVLQQVMRSKKIKFPKRWMFKYKASNLETKVTETSDQCTRNRVFVSANRRTKNDQPTLRSLMNTKQSCISLRTNRVWDPGGSLVDAATPRLLSLHLVTAILSSLQNLEVKVSSKEGDLIQEMRGHVEGGD